jgi:hypothetical protein
MLDLDDLLARSQADLFWLPPDARVVSRSEITYVCSPSDIGYLNAVVRLDAPDEQMGALAAEVSAAHAGVASRFMLMGGSRRPAVERALAAAGYHVEHEMIAHGIATDAFVPRATPEVLVERVVDLAHLRRWAITSARGFERPADLEGAHLARDLALSTGEGARVHRFTALDRASGAPLAAAGLTVFPALSFGLLWAGSTVPDARGRGAYSALVAARVAHARSLGVRFVGLYARVGTSAPIVAKQGFAAHGPMTYWVRPVIAPTREAAVDGPPRSA